jgi:pimeloyl-ACP methyl ester carboxylesterase
MTVYGKVEVDGCGVFYREAGKREDPAILLLHGFPSSSHMYRDLIRDLSDDFRLVAPDYVGFGNSDMPTTAEFDYTFDNLSGLVEGFVEKLGLDRFVLYVQDYGAPVGFRLASRRPELVEALIVQNAVTYEEGLGENFDVVKAIWKDRNQETEKGIRDLLTPEFTKLQYTAGAGDLEKVSPDSYNMDQYFLDRPGNADIQVELQYDYRNNPPLYPEWQRYFREHQPPTLVAWGRNDILFTEEGARAYERDLENVEVHLLDAGHFALEEKHEEVAGLIREFYSSRVAVTERR